MKKTITTFVLFTFLISSCGNKKSSSSDVYQEVNERQVNTTLNYVEEVEMLNELLLQQDSPTQKFQVSSNKQATITGKQGTVIHIRPSDLETIDGQPIGNTIDVELKECTHQEALFRSNVQTVSNGQLLVSGGAYYINMTSEGEQLRIKAGKTVEMDFPVLAEEEMEFFYGQRDSLGRMNWIVAEQKLEKREDIALSNVSEIEVSFTVEPMVIFEVNGVSDTVKNFSQEEFEKIQAQRMAEKADFEKRRKEQERQRELQLKLYNSVKVNQFGWVNVDRFLKADNATNLSIVIENGNLADAIVIYLVFKDINSVLNTFYYPQEAIARFSRIPAGYDVRMIALAMDKDGNRYSYSCDFTINKNEEKNIRLQKTETQNWDKLFDLSDYCKQGKNVLIVD